MENTKPASAGENLFIAALSIPVIFYFVFIYQTVWNWFVSDFLVPVTYWQMFLGLFIFKFIFLPNGKYSNIKATEKAGKEETFGIKFENLIFKLFTVTVGFGIFFVIHLIIAYYGIK